MHSEPGNLYKVHAKKTREIIDIFHFYYQKKENIKKEYHEIDSQVFLAKTS